MLTGACVLRLSHAVESSFVADTYTFLVETATMRTDLFYRTGRLYITVLADIKMIPCSVESAPAVADIQIIFREALVLARGGAMEYY